MKIIIILLSCFLPIACQDAPGVMDIDHKEEVKKMKNPKWETATFGSGCFWCVEAVFQQLEGVESVISGYSGGKEENPTYEQICSKLTGHAEVCQIKYDPKKITFDELLEVFWKTHDPTTINQQGNDKGPQYRSIILYHNEEQKTKAEAYKKKLNEEKAWKKPVITEVEAFTRFYSAENYHQNYYNLNSQAPYCVYVVQPKVEKFQKIFKNKLKNK